LEPIAILVERTAVREVSFREIYRSSGGIATRQRSVRKFAGHKTVSGAERINEASHELLIDLIRIPSGIGVEQRSVIDYIAGTLDPKIWHVRHRLNCDTAGIPKQNLLATMNPIGISQSSSR